MGFVQVGGERERERKAGIFFQKSSSPLSLHSQGRRICTMPFNGTMSFFFGRKGNGFGSDPTWVMTVMIMMIK
jgi:hypothetical protein